MRERLLLIYLSHSGVYYNRKSDYVVAVRSDARLLIHDFSVAKKRLKTFEHNGHIKSMEYDAKNHRLFFGGFNGIISIYDLAGKKLAQITGHDGEPLFYYLSPLNWLV